MGPDTFSMTCEAETFSNDNVAKNIFGILASLRGCIIELDNRWRLNTVVPVMHKQLYRKNPIPVVNKLLKADRDVLSNLIMHIRDPLTLRMTIFCLMIFDSIGIVPRFAHRHFMGRRTAVYLWFLLLIDQRPFLWSARSLLARSSGEAFITHLRNVTGI